MVAIQIHYHKDLGEDNMADIYSILAGKGRGEDEHIRKVFGEPSHVNEVEKDAIDIYGLLGEIFTKKVGTGDTNPNTGLPEYDYKKTYDVFQGGYRKKRRSPHNKAHDKFKKTGGKEGKHQRSHKTPQEIEIDRQQQRTTSIGEALLDPTPGEDTARYDPETGGSLSIGKMGLGQESYTAEEYQGMTPQQIVDDIFAKQYNNMVPPDMDKTEAEFKAELAGRLQYMPQFKGVDPEALGYEEEAKDIAVEQASITAQKGAQQVGGAMRSAYGGGGAGVRAGIGAGAGLAKTYGLGMETADLTYRKGVYGLEQQAGADWEADYSSYLGTLPSPA